MRYVATEIFFLCCRSVLRGLVLLFFLFLWIFENLTRAENSAPRKIIAVRVGPRRPKSFLWVAVLGSGTQTSLRIQKPNPAAPGCVLLTSQSPVSFQKSLLDEERLLAGYDTPVHTQWPPWDSHAQLLPSTGDNSGAHSSNGALGTNCSFPHSCACSSGPSSAQPRALPSLFPVAFIVSLPCIISVGTTCPSATQGFQGPLNSRGPVT